jgi:hypothetical protein
MSAAIYARQSTDQDAAEDALGRERARMAAAPRGMGKARWPGTRRAAWRGPHPCSAGAGTASSGACSRPFCSISSAAPVGSCGHD